MHVHLILDLRFSLSLFPNRSRPFAARYNYDAAIRAIGSFRGRRNGAYCILYRSVMSRSAARAFQRDTLPLIIRARPVRGGETRARGHSRRDRKCVLCAG